MASATPPQTLQNAQSSAPARILIPERSSGGRGTGGRRPHGARGDGGRNSGRGHYARGRGADGGNNGRDARVGEGGRGGGHVESGRSGRTNFSRPSNINPNDSSASILTLSGSPTHPASSVPFGYLPPFLPGASSLVEQLDQKMLVVLRDGRHLVGTLRTFDQFSNMVLEDTSERRILVVPREKNIEDGKKVETICYQADVELGLYVVRGDSVVLMGELYYDGEQDEVNDGKIRLVSLEELERLQEEERKRTEENGKVMNHIDWEFDLDLIA